MSLSALSANLVHDAVRPVWLIGRDGTPVRETIVERGLQGLAIAAVALGATLLVMWMIAVLKRRPTTPTERAFHALAWRLGLGPAGRRVVAELARAHGVATPVALLLSRSAFQQACEAYEATRTPSPKELRVLESVRRKVFGRAA